MELNNLQLTHLEHSQLRKQFSKLDKDAKYFVLYVQKFHLFLYGREVVLVTDHQALVTIYAWTQNNRSSAGTARD